MLLLHTPHLHAQVLRLNDHHHAERVERFLDAVFYLCRQPLLHLQTAGKHIHHAGYLAQTRNLAVGDVGDMHLAEKRQQMVLAQRVEINVFHHHHLAVVFLKEGALEDGLRVFLIPFGQKLERFADAAGGLLQPLALGVFADQRQRFLEQGGQFVGDIFVGLKCLQIHNVGFYSITCIISLTT